MSVYWCCPFCGAAFWVFRAEAGFLLWPFLVFVSVYLCRPCAGRHLLFFVPQGDFLRGVFQRKVSKRKALRELGFSRCVISGEWQPAKCRPHTSWDIGPRAIPARAHSTPVTKPSSTRLRATRVVDRHNLSSPLVHANRFTHRSPNPVALSGRTATNGVRSGMNERCVTGGAVREIRSRADPCGFTRGGDTSRVAIPQR
ncbi:hypothetical protein R52603_02260 [Paraburkholderia saeva]|uniref:Uncharacterized protein n=1 Tax=Paraburkholderia saeva TaxID=2777537 RepID=A0A9N8S1D4_9BURK|nr:hypothetical protein R70241_01115 [Paraburkholderia saeva]CAG4896911.1 hypothetical protein R52603_02260 [Paraburkholderia saeva]CAG4921582.1 hypothetical protein LMG31841_05104 [Paraburkholderia saeva]